jgi:hypothetical protein
MKKTSLSLAMLAMCACTSKSTTPASATSEFASGGISSGHAGFRIIDMRQNAPDLSVESEDPVDVGNAPGVTLLVAKSLLLQPALTEQTGAACQIVGSSFIPSDGNREIDVAFKATAQQDNGDDPTCVLAFGENYTIRLTASLEDQGINVDPNAADPNTPVVGQSTVDLLGKALSDGMNLMSPHKLGAYLGGACDTGSQDGQVDCQFSYLATGQLNQREVFDVTYSFDGKTIGQLIGLQLDDNSQASVQGQPNDAGFDNGSDDPAFDAKSAASAEGQK